MVHNIWSNDPSLDFQHIFLRDRNVHSHRRTKCRDWLRTSFDVHLRFLFNCHYLIFNIFLNLMMSMYLLIFVFQECILTPNLNTKVVRLLCWIQPPMLNENFVVTDLLGNACWQVRIINMCTLQKCIFQVTWPCGQSFCKCRHYIGGRIAQLNPCRFFPELYLRGMLTLIVVFA